MKIRNSQFDWGSRTYLMGILNVTPDSFSDGGQFNNLQAAVTQATKMVENGADIIDIGGQSTRPGAIEISLEEELSRVIPIIEKIRDRLTVPISIDTTKAEVARAAIAAGADLINDISGGTFDELMLPTAAQLKVPIILMHMRGTPQTMQSLTEYEDLIAEMSQFFSNQIQKAIDCGIDRSKIIIDPGIGFAKNLQQNLEIIKHVGEFKALNVPLLVGASRKSFIGKILDRPNPQQRVLGTAAACCSAIYAGADILRVHDIAEISDVCRVTDAIWRRCR
jgi:dihydropteroate synthase